MSTNRKMFLFVVLPIVIIFITVSFFANRGLRNSAGEAGNINLPKASDQMPRTKNSSIDEPPLKLKSIGINLDTYNPATGMAGDLKFTKAKFSSGIQLLFSDFGYTIKAAYSASGQDKTSPQPTFIAPMGTKVMALVDGVVVDIPTLYSNDYSVMVAPDKKSQWRYETEHVINPIVKVGDRVKAGQVVAEVSGYDAHGYDGLGLFEIGVMKGGQTPQHICPFAHLDDSIKEAVRQKLTNLYKEWEEYRGDTSLYDEAVLKMPGCLSLDPV